MVSSLFPQSPVSDLQHFGFNGHVYSGKYFYINIGVDGPEDLGNSCFRTWLFKQNKCPIDIL